MEHKIRSKIYGKTRTVNLTPIKAIRAMCLDCVGHSAEEVKLCTDPLCPLYPYRFGKNPARKGQGSKESAKKARKSLAISKKSAKEST